MTVKFAALTETMRKIPSLQDRSQHLVSHLPPAGFILAVWLQLIRSHVASHNAHSLHRNPIKRPSGSQPGDRGIGARPLYFSSRLRTCAKRCRALARRSTSLLRLLRLMGSAFDGRQTWAARESRVLRWRPHSLAWRFQTSHAIPAGKSFA